jgi:hypothetical protein
VRKIPAFLSLQAGVRCKIVKTMKFPAKSSRERSYACFQPLAAASGWKAATCRDDDWEKDFQNHCATKLRNYLQTHVVRQASVSHMVGKSYKYSTLGAKTRTRRKWGTRLTAHGVPGNKWG